MLKKIVRYLYDMILGIETMKKYISQVTSNCIILSKELYVTRLISSMPILLYNLSFISFEIMRLF